MAKTFSFHIVIFLFNGKDIFISQCHISLQWQTHHFTLSYSLQWQTHLHSTLQYFCEVSHSSSFSSGVSSPLHYTWSKIHCITLEVKPPWLSNQESSKWSHYTWSTTTMAFKPRKQQVTTLHLKYNHHGFHTNKAANHHTTLEVQPPWLSHQQSSQSPHYTWSKTTMAFTPTKQPVTTLHLKYNHHGLHTKKAASHHTTLEVQPPWLSHQESSQSPHYTWSTTTMAFTPRKQPVTTLHLKYNHHDLYTKKAASGHTTLEVQPPWLSHQESRSFQHTRHRPQQPPWSVCCQICAAVAVAKCQKDPRDSSLMGAWV